MSRTSGLSRTWSAHWLCLDFGLDPTAFAITAIFLPHSVIRCPPRVGNPPNPDGEANMPEDNDAAEKNAESTLIAAERDLLRKAIELAKAGDGPMLKFLLGRSLPRERPVKIDLPQFEFADDAIDGLAEVSRAIADGEIA